METISLFGSLSMHQLLAFPAVASALAWSLATLLASGAAIFAYTAKGDAFSLRNASKNGKAHLGFRTPAFASHKA